MTYLAILPNEYLKLSQQQHLKSRTTLLTVSHRMCTRYCKWYAVKHNYIT